MCSLSAVCRRLSGQSFEFRGLKELKKKQTQPSEDLIKVHRENKILFSGWKLKRYCEWKSDHQETARGRASLVVQWLRLCAFSAGDVGSISGRGTKIPYASWCCQKKRRRRRKGSVQFSWDAQSCPAFCDSMDCNTPAFPVHHQLSELAQTHVHWVGDAIQPYHPLSSLSSPSFNLSEH